MKTDGNPELQIVAQRWTDIGSGEAQLVLGSLQEPLTVQSVASHSGRPTAAASLVNTNRGLVFIKRYARQVRDADTIAPYHRFAEHLADHGIPTPRFLRFADRQSPQPSDSTVFTLNGNAYEAYFAATGQDRYGEALTWSPPETLQEARALGAFVARLTLASQGFDEPALKPNGMSNKFGLFASTDLDGSWSRWLAERPKVARYLTDTNRDPRHEWLKIIPYAEQLDGRYDKLPTAWTHGDPHTSNFLWEGPAPSAVIDFGLADRNTALFDLAMLLERHTIQWVDVMGGDETAYRADVADALLDGYCSIRPLTDPEKAMLPYLLAICQAEAGLNWLQYYLNVGGPRPEDAAWCYDECFVAHTAWFSTDSGKRMLEHIQNRLR